MKKNRFLLFGMLAATLTFALAVAGCKTDADDDSGGEAFVITIDGLTSYVGKVVGITYATGNTAPQDASGHLPKEATITVDGKATVSFAIDSQMKKELAANQTEVFICIDGSDNSSFTGIAGTAPEIGRDSQFGDYSKTKVVFGAKTVTKTYPGDFKNGATDADL
ncbi:MAG: hypothetical protein LBH85_03065 [Treponema sp.]|nr:hypothetical protein [Treponema sp.]